MSENDEGWIIEGTGGRLKTPDDVVNTGNSGTATTLLIAMSSLAEGYSVITGDYQIRRRPQKAMVDVLNDLGAQAAGRCRPSLRLQLDLCFRLASDGAALPGRRHRRGGGAA